MEKLAAAEQKFAKELPPVEALRAWLLLFVDNIAEKQLIAPALNALVGHPKKVFEASYARIWEAIRALVKSAIGSGDIRPDLDPMDLLRALIGAAGVATSPDWHDGARRLRRYPDHRCSTDAVKTGAVSGLDTLLRYTGA